MACNLLYSDADIRRDDHVEDHRSDA
jgi:hypothetical protein